MTNTLKIALHYGFALLIAALIWDGAAYLPTASEIISRGFAVLLAAIVAEDLIERLRTALRAYQDRRKSKRLGQ